VIVTYSMCRRPLRSTSSMTAPPGEDLSVRSSVSGLKILHRRHTTLWTFLVLSGSWSSRRTRMNEAA
jgi:hypothetical protein